MARAVFSEIVTDLSGRIGGHVWTKWKGIPVCKLAPTHFKVARQSLPRFTQLKSAFDCVRSWQNDLSIGQKADWETYAAYLATLPTDYVKLTGLKNYGGTMSGFNAFTLVNSFRSSIGMPSILEDAPNAGTDPDTPTLNSLTYSAGPPKKLTANVTLPASFPEQCYLRVWCRGTRGAHLIMPAYEPAQGEEPFWSLNYTADALPEDSTPAWTHLGGAYGSVAAGILTIDTTGGASYFCYYRMSGLTEMINSRGFTIEAKMKVITSANPDVRLILRFTDDARVASLAFSQTQIALLGPIDSYNMDTTDAFHVYRITVIGSTIKVYVDNILRMSGTIPTATSAQRIEFGDAIAPGSMNSKSEWDYVKFYPYGPCNPDGTQEIDWTKMRYAQGNEANLIPDVYKCQVDLMGEDGRFSPPSEIISAKVT
jgi:hypothetical protein